MENAKNESTVKQNALNKDFLSRIDQTEVIFTRKRVQPNVNLFIVFDFHQ